ncbi:MAG: cytidylate kinase-like family protein [Nitrospiraceae bacterium]|nr:cytidylate kinase-like family protein [Nitrospiraceae bacterium]
MDRPKKTILITVSRQFGSGGAYLGQRLAKRLGYKYLDREILSRATEYLGSEEDLLSKREERLSGFWENILRAFMLGTPETAYVPPPIRPVYDADLFKAESMIISQTADRYDSVIVGRGGYSILRGRPGLVNVFVHAPMDFRIRRVMEGYKIASRDEAASLIEETDGARGRFLDSITGGSWTDALNYHLCIDTARAGFDAAEEMAIALVDSVRQRLAQS